MPEGFTPEYFAIAGLLVFLSIKLILNNILGLKKGNKKKIQQKSEVLLGFWEEKQSSNISERVNYELGIFQNNYYLWRGGVLADDEFQESLDRFEQTTKSFALLPR